MCTARPPWLTVSTRTSTYKKDCNHIEVDLRDVLEVDTERMVVRGRAAREHGPAHPIPRAQRATHSRSWSRWKILTAGGLAMGLGMETTCHRYGLLQETVVAYEIVTADGSLQRVTQRERPGAVPCTPVVARHASVSWWPSSSRSSGSSRTSG